LLLLVALLLAGYLGWDEYRSSERQALYFSQLVRRVSCRLGPGPSPAPLLSPNGPYDQRLGYAGLPQMTRLLEANGFVVEEQARASETMQELTRLGIFPIYREKTQAGLRILDRHAEVIYSRLYPERIFQAFSEIPPVAAQILLYIENRELLDPDRPFLNPAIEWDRLGRAVLDRGRQMIVPGFPVSGGSTLAIQLEKFQHSPGGVTGSVGEKIRQALSASLRAYLDGENTLAARKEIVLNYINSVPLAARPDYGEINGLGDGLWAWYGAEMGRTVDILNHLEDDDIPDEEKSLAVKQVLSLFIGVKKPTYYFRKNAKALDRRCEAYLPLLAAEGILPPRIEQAAHGLPLVFRPAPLPSPHMTLQEKKATNAVRAPLFSVLDVGTLYDLDRLDLEVTSTIDLPVQLAVSRQLQSLRDPAYVTGAGLRGPRLLDRGDLSKIIYSFALYERTPGGNVLRVQTDSYDQPLNINEGVKLDLGSTAKLRTLAHYLQIVAFMHGAYGGMPPGELGSLQVGPKDPLRQWAIAYLANTRDRRLRPMLEAAIERTYPASTGERFFTGGGIHTFENFNKEEDSRTYSVREGLKKSVNLVFIRLMRDIVRWHMYHEDKGMGNILSDRGHPDRNSYLGKFADYEGSKFIRMFYRKYKGKPRDEAMTTLLHSVHPVPRRLAVAYRAVDPEADFGSFQEALMNYLEGSKLGERTLEKLYRAYAPGKFSLSDQGYLARMHPLELWTAARLQKDPDTDLTQILAESAQPRQDVYRWLFRSTRKAAQDRRIKTILEIEAFVEILQEWKNLGFPFDSLVPSYATAIGSSGDRPAALSDLMGILLNDGVRLPPYRVEEMTFAAGTPYEVRFAHHPGPGKQVLDPEIARLLQEVLQEVVSDGTAVRALHAFRRKDGSEIPVGGKTGTGDHRYEIFGTGGRLISSKVMNRSSTFVFFVGDRFHGTLTAYVPGADAAAYDFTSSLPVAVLRLLAPKLMPLIDADESRSEDREGPAHE
jgi:membrane peptidoglycan carboxypeptidase